MYEHFENDKKKADEWYRKAVKPGSLKGDSGLSRGDTLDVSYAQYMDGFEEPSVARNYVRLDQLLRVAVCRYFGLGTEKDICSAEKLMHYAVYERHCVALADFYMKMVTQSLTLEEAKREIRKNDPYHTTEFEQLLLKSPADARTDKAMIWGTSFVIGNTSQKALHANSFKYLYRLRGVPQGAYRMFTRSIAFEGRLVIRDYKDNNACCTWKSGHCLEGGNGRGYYRRGRYVTGIQEGPWTVFFADGRIFRLIFKKGKPTGKALLEKDGKMLWKGEISDSQGLNAAVRNAGLDTAAAGYDALLSAAKNTEKIIVVKYRF